MSALLKDKKNWIILVLLAILVIGGIFGGRAVSKFNETIAVLKYSNTGLGLQIADRELQIKVLQSKAEEDQFTIDSCMRAFKAKDFKIAQLEKNLNDALGQLEGISSDSSYKFLQEIAYKYPGLLEYLFNKDQVKAIHADYLRARSADKVIPELHAQIDNCRFQFAERDSLVNKLSDIVDLQGKNLADCKQMTENDKIIIDDLQKTADKERRRKNLWRTISALEPVAFLVLLAL